MNLHELYTTDETAWLDRMAELAGRGDRAALDLDNLAEYLESMAGRDRREVGSRSARLIEHILKWMYQPSKRGNSWRRTIVVQQRDLAKIVHDSGVLRRHAEATLMENYRDGVRAAAAATGINASAFPATCPWTLDELLDYQF